MEIRAQADALEIEAGAKRRLAVEYDAAQERGEVRGDQIRRETSEACSKIADERGKPPLDEQG